jgi:arylsulfatase A-like enzyme
MHAARRTGFLLPLAAALALGDAARAADRPNFVFVYTDDQRWDALGVVQRERGDKGRFPWIKTPNMDRLADEGIRFRNMFVVNSLCAPSRASFLTGCYGHVNGIVNNHTQFNDKNVTYATLLRAAGYRTGYIGKWHMDSQSGQRPGFDFSASFVGQGRYVDCPIEVNGKSTPSKGWVDDVGTDYAIQFIKENKDKPFMLAVGFKACHGPFDPPARRKDDYAGELARAVPNLTRPAIYREDATKPTEAPPDKVPTNLNYFRCITAADDNLGRILKTLDELKLSDDTVVIFTSDNGYYLGEHGLGDKRSAYEESMRIPLIVRYPRLAKKGKTLDQLALNIDIAPTMLDFAGVAVPRAMHGRSWRPLLEGKEADWRKAFFYCYFYENNTTVPTVTAVRTEKAKLVKYPAQEKWTELFDLSRDPFELKNLIDEPAAKDLRAELEAEYERQAKAIAFRIPDFADDPKKDVARAPLKAWVLDYHFDKDDGDKVHDASGKDNHGAAKGAPLVEGRKGAKARQFDGKGYIEVTRSQSLDPAVAGWTIEATFKADKPEGVLLARGGAANGYCLHLEGGRPVFTVTSGNRASQLEARQNIVGEWTQLTARITADKQLVLAINGKEVARGKLHNLIRNDPRDSMQIGADLGSRVVADKMLPHFVGLIESVRLYSGEAP